MFQRGNFLKKVATKTGSGLTDLKWSVPVAPT